MNMRIFNLTFQRRCLMRAQIAPRKAPEDVETGVRKAEKENAGCFSEAKRERSICCV
jgi:hypothetical protein